MIRFCKGMRLGLGLYRIRNRSGLLPGGIVIPAISRQRGGVDPEALNA